MLLLLLRNQLDVRNNEAYNFFKFVRKLGVPLNNFKPKFVALFVAAGMAFSVFFSVVSSVESSRNLLFSTALSERNFVVFHIRSN